MHELPVLLHKPQQVVQCDGLLPVCFLWHFGIAPSGLHCIAAKGQCGRKRNARANGREGIPMQQVIRDKFVSVISFLLPEAIATIAAHGILEVTV